MYVHVEYPYVVERCAIDFNGAYIRYDPQCEMNISEWRSLICELLGDAKSIYYVLFRPFDSTEYKIGDTRELDFGMMYYLGEACVIIKADDVDYLRSILQQTVYSDEGAIINDPTFDVVILFHHGHKSMDIYCEFNSALRVGEILIFFLNPRPLGVDPKRFDRSIV